MPSASDEWSQRFEGIWRSCYRLQRSIVALRVTKPPTKHVTDGVGNIISAPAVTFFVGCHTWHLRATETQRAQHFSPRNCWRSAALPGRSGEVVRKKSTCYNNIPRKAFLSLETLNHWTTSDLFRSWASWLALSFTKSGCWLQISKSFATISSHASFRSSNWCASVRLQNAKSTAIGSTETGLNRTC